MSERYTKLFSLPENLYAEGAPVIVSAGNLLKDNQTGKVLVQLKIKNISAKPLKAATVLIHPQDAAGQPMEGDAQQKYLDLTAKTGEEFGQKIAVFLPDASARGFSVEVTQVVFFDSSTWEGTAAPWEPLPASESLRVTLGDAELVKQYQIQFSGRCEVAPKAHKDLWLCACGAWNKDGTCYCCGSGKAAQLFLDLNALKADRDARLAQEKADREAKAAADKAAAEASARKTKKLLAILIPIVIACIAALLLYNKVILPANQYKKAAALFSSEHYDESTAVFESLAGYKDSAQKAVYAKAFSLMQKEQYAEAEALFAEMNYEDSAEMAKKAGYAVAESLIENGLIDEAIARFDSLGDYQDSSDRASALRYELGTKLIDAGDYTAALPYFEAIPDYRDSAEKLERIRQDYYQKEKNYLEAEALLKSGDRPHAAMRFYLAGDYNDAYDRSYELWNQMLPSQTISANGGTMAVLTDGTVVATGNYPSYRDVLAKAIGKWKNVTDVAYGAYVAAVLKSDHTAECVDLVTGSFGTNIKSWQGIVKISADAYTVLGLRADGQVLLVGEKYPNWDSAAWTDIVDIDVGAGVAIGLKADGTAVIAFSNDYHYDTASISKWSGLVAVSAGSDHVYGLKSDGTVLAADSREEYVFTSLGNVGSWKNIVAISAGWNMVVGLKSDGSIVCLAGWGEYDRFKPNNVIAISAGISHIVVLTADGKLLAEGNNEDGACNVSDWKNIKLP